MTAEMAGWSARPPEGLRRDRGGSGRSQGRPWPAQATVTGDREVLLQAGPTSQHIVCDPADCSTHPPLKLGRSKLPFAAIKEGRHPLLLFVGLKEDGLREIIDQRVRPTRGVQHRLGQTQRQTALTREPVSKTVSSR